jgi:hypothetical protein
MVLMENIDKWWKNGRNASSQGAPFQEMMLALGGLVIFRKRLVP